MLGADLADTRVSRRRSRTSLDLMYVLQVSFSEETAIGLQLILFQGMVRTKVTYVISVLANHKMHINSYFEIVCGSNDRSKFPLILRRIYYDKV